MYKCEEINSDSYGFYFLSNWDCCQVVQVAGILWKTSETCRITQAHKIQKTFLPRNKIIPFQCKRHFFYLFLRYYMCGIYRRSQNLLGCQHRENTLNGSWYHNKRMHAIYIIRQYQNSQIEWNLRGTLFTINIIQVCGPTSDKDEEKRLITFTLRLKKWWKILKRERWLLSWVASMPKEKLVGSFELATTNQRGDRLDPFCREKELIITKTVYKLQHRRLHIHVSHQWINRI